MADIITVNVGGITYSTKRETLIRFPDSRLNHMFSPSPSTKCNQDEKGNYFIDRDGDSFRHILNFLRLGVLRLPKKFSEYELLIGEAQFYGLWEMVRALEPLHQADVAASAAGPGAGQVVVARPPPPREYLVVERLGGSWVVRAHIETSRQLAAVLNDANPKIKDKSDSRSHFNSWSSYHLPSGAFKVDDFIRILPFIISLGFTPYCPAMSMREDDYVFVRG